DGHVVHRVGHVEAVERFSGERGGFLGSGKVWPMAAHQRPCHANHARRKRRTRRFSGSSSGRGAVKGDRAGGGGIRSRRLPGIRLSRLRGVYPPAPLRNERSLKRRTVTGVSGRMHRESPRERPLVTGSFTTAERRLHRRVAGAGNRTSCITAA